MATEERKRQIEARNERKRIADANTARAYLGYLTGTDDTDRRVRELEERVAMLESRERSGR